MKDNYSRYLYVGIMMCIGGWMD